MSRASTSDLLRERGAMLAAVRAFFHNRSVLEVDVPLLSRSAPIDPFIEVVQASCLGKPAYLHTSPEYGMKRLLCSGSGDIYQLSHVYRDCEWGERHAVEFMMVEWYRLGFQIEELMSETLALIQLFLPLTDFEVLPYTEVAHGHDDESFALEVEPTLGRGKVTFLYGYPPEKALLARVNEKGVAERFEVFVEGVELGNGYSELADPAEQRERLEKANAIREALGKERYPIDQNFLDALEIGLPPCCGVAVGFDRLMMLKEGEEDISNILPFRGL